MDKYKYDVHLHAKQGEALNALADPLIETLGYGGAKGGGKSYLGRTWQVLRRLKYANSKGLLIRKSFPELERTHIEMLKKELPKELYEYSEKSHKFVFPNGSILEMAYVEREQDVDRYWGAEFDDIFVDETQQHQKKVFQTLRACLRTTRKDLKTKLLLCFNWGGIGHGWLKRMFWEKLFETGENPAHFSFLFAKVYDNPSIMENDPQYIERLQALPEQMRKAYLDGDPNVFEGQFFSEFGSHLREQPFHIEPSDCQGRLVGSLDSGIAHSTSFGLWYIDNNLSIHRLFTYLGNGMTIRAHAEEIYQRIESFSFTNGYFPDMIYADPSMWTKVKLNDAMVRSPIDEYIDHFREKNKHSRFEKANNEKINGCQVMRGMFKGSDKMPSLFYFGGFNSSFEEGIQAASTDKNNIEIYQKQDGDDVVDEARYGIVACYSAIATLKQRREETTPKTHLQKLLAGEFATKSNPQEWYNV